VIEGFEKLVIFLAKVPSLEKMKRAFERVNAVVLERLESEGELRVELHWKFGVCGFVKA